MIDNNTPKVPQHVAIIMDGNGRWAQGQGQNRLHGHTSGVESVRRVVRAAVKSGVKYVTIYAFSTENWGRPKDEVQGLMELFNHSVANEVTELIEQGVRLKFIGDRTSLSPDVQQTIAVGETMTADNSRLTLVIALNYSARWEITEAVRQIAQKSQDNILNPSDIDHDMVAEHLSTKGIPDPDLLIRTSGECRLSNFLLWQLAYSELYFTPKLWPEFTEEDFVEAINTFSQRDRRFGLVK